MKHLLLALALVTPIEILDRVVQERVQGLRGSVLEQPMRKVSRLGQRDLILGTLLGIAIFGGPPGVATARTAVAAALPVNVTVEGLKWAVNRERPDGERKRSNSSFPSSHAANAFALAAVFARCWRRWAPAFWLLAALVAISRIYLNRHFLSDVLAGAALGWVLAWMVMSWLDRRKRGGASSRG